MESAATIRELRREVEAREWYHTLELAPGVETPGWFDLREVSRGFPIPESLSGKRCLDVGTFDGFWAYEMERRGARGVVAVDVNDPDGWDWPADSTEEAVAAIARRKAGGSGFELAHRALGSRVERLDLSVYDLDPSEIGEFELIYLGSLLIHLRDPVAALERVRSVCSRTLVLCDAIDTVTTTAFRRRPVATLDGRGRPWWWKPNLAALVRMVEAAGFTLTAEPRRLRLPPGRGQPRLRPTMQIVASRRGREELGRTWRGDPHAILVAAPNSS